VGECAPLAWIRCGMTFREDGSQDTERRYRLAPISHLFLDRIVLPLLPLGLFEWQVSTTTLGVLLTMIVHHASQGQYLGAEVHAYGFDLTTGMWQVIVSHPQFAPVEEGCPLPRLSLEVTSADINALSEDLRAVLLARGEEVRRDG
jgi:hypothetical protein